jgi:cell shape-determining protein MreD
MDQIFAGAAERAQAQRTQGSRVHARGAVLVTAAALAVSFAAASFKAVWSPLWVFPDVALIAVAWLALRAELSAAALSAFALGFFLGGLSLAPSGAEPLTLITAALAAAALSRVLEFSGGLYAAVLVLFLFSLSNLAIYPLLIYIGYGNQPFNVISQYFSIYCIQGALTAAAAPFVFRLLDRLAPGGR